MPKPTVRAVLYAPFTGRLKTAGPEQKLLGDLLGDKDKIDARRQNLVDKIVQAATILKSTFPDDPPDTLAIFMAPEWYFRPKTYAYTREEMLETVQDLIEKSAVGSLRNMLIIPGTIFWGEVISKGGIRSPKVMRVYNCAPVIKGGRILSLVHKLNEADIVDKKREVWGIQSLEQAAQLSHQVLADLGQTEGGIDVQGFFEIGDLRFAIDICKDHSDKRLKQIIKSSIDAEADFPDDWTNLLDAAKLQILNAYNAKYRDIHLLTTCGNMERNDGVVAKTGGYVLRCDGNASNEQDNRFSAAVKSA